MMPASRPSASTMTTQPNFLLRHLHHRVRHLGADGDEGDFVAGPHDLGQMRQRRAELAGGVEAAEVVRREAPRFQEGDRKRIADRKLKERGGRRRQSMRAGFGDFRQGQHHVRVASQWRAFARREGDQRNGEAARIGNDAFELGALARPRHGQHDIAAGDHAEIAVVGLGRMHEKRRCAGGGERRGDLRADMSALADAGDDDPALDVRQKVDRPRERLGQSVVEGLGQRRKAGLFDGYRAQGRSDRRFRVRRFLQATRMHGDALSAFGRVCPLMIAAAGSSTLH